MGLSFKKGTFALTTAAATNTQTIAIGFEPKIVIAWGSGIVSTVDAIGRQNSKRWFGITDGTNYRCVATQAEDAQTAADCDCGLRDAAHIFTITVTRSEDSAYTSAFNTPSSGDWTLTVTNQAPSAFQCEYIAIGGSDITNITLGTLTHPNSDGGTVTVDLGYTPDMLFHFGCRQTTVALTADTDMFIGAFDGTTMALLGGASNDGAADMQAMSYCRTGEVIGIFDGACTGVAQQATVEFLSGATNGFKTTHQDTAATDFLSFYCAIKGGQWKVFSDTTETDTSTAIALSGWGFQPSGGMVFSAGKAEDALNTPSDHQRWSVGGWESASVRGCQATMDEDATADSEITCALETDAVLALIDTSSAIYALMDVQSVDSGGVTFIMDDADTAQSFFWGWAVGPEEAAPAGQPTMTRWGGVPHMALTGRGGW